MGKEIEIALHKVISPCAGAVEKYVLHAPILWPGPLKDRSLGIVVYAKESIGGVTVVSLLRSILGWS